MAKQAESKEVATRPNDTTPAWMKEDEGAGREGFERGDIETPRLKLMQGSSKEIEAYDDLKPGHFFHTSTEAIFKGPFRGVPIFFEKRFLLWRPLDDGGGILARADDAKHWSPPNVEFEVNLDKSMGGGRVKWKTSRTVRESGLAEWGSMNPADVKSPPAATLMYNYLLAFPEQPDMLPAVMTFQRASIKAGRQWNSRLMTVRTPLYGLIFEFSAVKVSNSAGKSFFTVNVNGAGKLQDENLYKTYRDMNKALTASGLKLREEQEEPVEEEDRAGGGGSAEATTGPAY